MPESVRDLPDFQPTFIGKLKIAERRIEINYRTAVPEYNEGHIQVVIPMSLESSIMDTALVVEDKEIAIMG